MRGVFFSLLLLTGCTTVERGVKTQIVEKPVLITQKCVKTENIPTRPRPLSDSQPTDLESAFSLSLSKISEWIRYGNKADEIFKNCK